MKKNFSSPKFLGMLSVLIVSITAFFTSDETVVQVIGLIVAALDVMVYVSAESYVEGAKEYAQVEMKKDVQWCKRTLNEVVRRLEQYERGGQRNAK